MPIIKLTTRISASIETVFDLSRSIDLHLNSTARTNEKAVAGCTSGLISLGEEVTWEATHLFVRQRLTTRIVAMTRPTHFRDSMVSGVFKRFDHDHIFETDGNHIIMRDVFDYTSPLWLLGRLADSLFLRRYMQRFLEERNQLIRSEAESGNIAAFIPEGPR